MKKINGLIHDEIRQHLSHPMLSASTFPRERGESFIFYIECGALSILPELSVPITGGTVSIEHLQMGHVITPPDQGCDAFPSNTL